jgi:hypothetical protein
MEPRRMETAWRPLLGWIPAQGSVPDDSQKRILNPWEQIEHEKPGQVRDLDLLALFVDPSASSNDVQAPSLFFRHFSLLHTHTPSHSPTPTHDPFPQCHTSPLAYPRRIPWSRALIAVVPGFQPGTHASHNLGFEFRVTGGRASWRASYLGSWGHSPSRCTTHVWTTLRRGSGFTW